jgi:acetyl-CoA carboxylase biotin carboxylase subunit
VIRALHELGIEAVAVYSTADADALHVRLADQRCCIGPPPPRESYLRIPSSSPPRDDRLRGVHPGYGFLAENPRSPGVRGQRPRLRRPAAGRDERMGDKARAKAAMRAAGVPLVPGTDGASRSVRHAGAASSASRCC